MQQFKKFYYIKKKKNAPKIRENLVVDKKSAYIIYECPKGIMTNFDEEGGEKNKGQKRKLEESNGDGAENNENGNGIHNGLVLFRLLLKQIERVHFMEA